MEKELRETVVSGELLFDGNVIKVEKWAVSLPDGRRAEREIVKHNGAAAVVPVDHQSFVTLVRQHRVAIDRITLEIPAGKLDTPQEDPFECAKRELEEETGLTARQWQKLAHVVTTPGFCTERIALYLATDLRKTPAHTDPDEFISLVRMPLAEAVMMVERGEIEDAKTCLGLLLAQRVLQQPAPLWQEGARRMQGTKDCYPQAGSC
jgi:ADP-ribose pyrophosphatase